MNESENLTLDEIKRVVCEKWHVTEQQFIGEGLRTDSVVRARSMAAYLARMFTNSSIWDICVWLGYIKQPTFRYWVMKYKAKVDALRSNSSFGNIRTQVAVGYSCEDFFQRSGPVAEIPLSAYIDLFLSVI